MVAETGQRSKTDIARTQSLIPPVPVNTSFTDEEDMTSPGTKNKELGRTEDAGISEDAGPEGGPERDMDGNLLEHTLLGNPEDFEELMNLHLRTISIAEPIEEYAETSPDLSELPEDIAEAIATAPEEAQQPLYDTYQRRVNKRKEQASQMSTLRESLDFTRQSVKLVEADAAPSLAGAEVRDWQYAGRHERALLRWEKHNAAWDKMRAKLSTQAGKHAEHLVMERGDEHRKKKELQDLVERGQPIEDRTTVDMWRMSLRNNWSKLVPCGNLFSGLFTTCWDTPNPSNVLSIRRSKPSDLAKSADLKPARARRTFEDSEFFQKRKNQYRGAIKRMLPHEPEELVLEGLGVVQEIEEQANQPVTLAEVEEALAESNAQAWTLIKAARAEALHREAEAEKERVEALAAEEAKKITGPRMTLNESHLSYFTAVGERGSMKCRLNNIGTTALYYTWTKLLDACDLPLGPQRAETHFYMHNQEGVLLPGDEKEMVFSFTSALPGAFHETWQVTTHPALPEPLPPMTLKGMVASMDNGHQKRVQLTETLAENMRAEKVARAVLDMVASIQTTTTSEDRGEFPGQLQGDKYASNFVHRNIVAVPTLYYNPKVYARFMEVFDAATALLEPEPEPVPEPEEDPNPKGKKSPDKRGGTPSDGKRGKPEPTPAKGKKGAKGKEPEPVVPDEPEEEPPPPPPLEWNGSVDSLADMVVRCHGAPRLSSHSEWLHLKHRLDSAVQEAMIPPCRKSVVERVVYSIIGDIADRIPEPVDDAIDEVKKMIEEDQIKAEEEAEIERMRKEEEENNKPQFVKDQEAAEAEAAHQALLEEHGGEIPEPEPEPPKEGEPGGPPIEGGDRFMQVFQRLNRPMVVDMWSTLEDRISEESIMIAAELGKRAQSRHDQGYYWSEFDIMRRHKDLLVGEVGEIVNSEHSPPKMLSSEVWSKRLEARLPQLSLRAALEAAKAQEAALEPLVAPSLEEPIPLDDILAREKEKLAIVNGVVTDLNLEALEEIKEWPKVPRYTQRIVQAVNIILGHATRMEPWVRAKNHFSQALVMKMLEHDAEQPKKKRAWHSMQILISGLSEDIVAAESYPAMVMLRWCNAVAAVSYAAFQARLAAAGEDAIVDEFEDVEYQRKVLAAELKAKADAEAERLARISQASAEMAAEEAPPEPTKGKK
ncbi:hypothetical protein CYMTET_6183 [Cymbomonas tetramitiformis]|uniref:Uncharacterized protein n=1 Tax=Cymbomonas tetramitiformis TaxID=36881 RepID=A0AAE0GY24_9CHLO|nr:hypothetical protein CYMTET_6183 [Cymbomonas tetramitiformis]